VTMVDPEKYQPARQNMKFVTRSLRSLATNFFLWLFEITQKKQEIQRCSTLWCSTLVCEAFSFHTNLMKFISLCSWWNYQWWWWWWWCIVFNATFSNISAISWWPVLVVEEIGVPEQNHQPWVNFITCGSESSAPFL
jgi:hypothetical protein